VDTAKFKDLYQRVSERIKGQVVFVLFNLGGGVIMYCRDIIRLHVARTPYRL
jgi:hypothetical protein